MDLVQPRSRITQRGLRSGWTCFQSQDVPYGSRFWPGNQALSCTKLVVMTQSRHRDAHASYALLAVILIVMSMSMVIAVVKAIVEVTVATHVRLVFQGGLRLAGSCHNGHVSGLGEYCVRVYLAIIFIQVIDGIP